MSDLLARLREWWTTRCDVCGGRRDVRYRGYHDEGSSIQTCAKCGGPEDEERAMYYCSGCGSRSNKRRSRHDRRITKAGA